MVQDHITVNVLKFQILYFIYFLPKLCVLCICYILFSGKANSVDPDQTARKKWF